MRLPGSRSLWLLLLGAICWFAPATPPEAVAASSTTCARPAGNSGKGFYVGCGRINNPGGTEYRVRGVVRTHFDVAAAPYIANTKANSVRTYYAYDTGTLGKFKADFQALLAQGLTPVASMDSYSGTLSSCHTDPSLLASQVSRWVRDAATWTLLNTQGMIDLSSEWGPGSASGWRDQSIAAVKTLRQAGYLMPVLIDSGTCSRNQPAFNALAAEVVAADPQHNVVFWVRLDGNTASSAAMHTLLASLAAASSANPQLAFVTGVFGPGSNLPPNPVMLTPDDMIQTSEADSLGWMVWTWDGSDQSGCVADGSSTSLLANPCSGYTGQSSQLTSYGQDVLAQLTSYVTGQPVTASAPPEAAQLGYNTNTFSVTNFNTANTVDTTNSQTAGFKFYPYNLIGATPPLNDFQFNSDGSLTLLGATTGPNGELVTATPINNTTAPKNKTYHGTGFGGGGLFEATLQFAAGYDTKGATGGFPAWWSQPLETAVTYAIAGSDAWPGQVAGYHHSVENDYMEYLGTGSGATAVSIIGGSLHESYGVSKVTCASGYCVYNSSLPTWTIPDLTQSHRYGYRWTVATATTQGKAEYLLDGVVQSSQSWTQFVGGNTQPPPPSSSTPWAFGAMDTWHYVLILGTGTGAPLKVISVDVWQKDATHNLVN